MGDVSMALEDETNADPDEDAEGPTTTTDEELSSAKGCMAAFVIMTAVLGAAAGFIVKKNWAVTVAHESGEQDYQRGPQFYNIIAPVVVIIVSFFMFCSVVGAAIAINTKYTNQSPKTDIPGYEGKSVVRDRIGNPGERAFFASFALVTLAFTGFMTCLFLRKSGEVQISASMIMKMGCRGFVAGGLATLAVEFIRLPFHTT